MKPKKPSAKKPTRDTKDLKPENGVFWTIINPKTHKAYVDLYHQPLLYSAREHARNGFAINGIKPATARVVRVRLTLEVLP